MIEKHEVEAAQQAWAEGIIDIGNADAWEEAHKRAEALVQKLYLHEDGGMLFCPTMASVSQFRRDLEGAVSYFVGRNNTYEEDKGFALKPWKSVRFENAGIVCRDGLAMAMGNYFFGEADGTETKVEYSFVYGRDGAGEIKIHLHHSALPYSGP